MSNGKLFAVVGTTRSGKSAFVKYATAHHRRKLVWDVIGDYQADIRVKTQKTLVQAVADTGNLHKTIAYTGKLSDFDFFCRCALIWLKIGADLKTTGSLIVEETADVTTPAKAPEHYGILLRRGLRYGSDVYAITQRPAESDKTSFANASIIHCCRLHYDNDCKYMARTLKVPQAEIEGLVADENKGRFDCIQRDMRTQEINRGVLSFASGKPKYVFSPL